MNRRLFLLRIAGGIGWVGGFRGALILNGAGSQAVAQDSLHREIRLIRRAYLDVTGFLPTPE